MVPGELRTNLGGAITHEKEHRRRPANPPTRCRCRLRGIRTSRSATDGMNAGREERDRRTAHGNAGPVTSHPRNHAPKKRDPAEDQVHRGVGRDKGGEQDKGDERTEGENPKSLHGRPRNLRRALISSLPRLTISPLLYNTQRALGSSSGSKASNAGACAV